MTLKQLNSDTDLFEIIANAFKRDMKSQMILDLNLMGINSIHMQHQIIMIWLMEKFLMLLF